MTSVALPPVVRIEEAWRSPRAVPLSCQNERGLTGIGVHKRARRRSPTGREPQVAPAAAPPRSKALIILYTAQDEGVKPADWSRWNAEPGAVGVSAAAEFQLPDLPGGLRPLRDAGAADDE
jgi:hypothetical protein